MTDQLTSNSSNVTIGKVQRVAEAAWCVLNHDNDPHSGLADDTANWHALTRAIRAELEKPTSNETRACLWQRDDPDNEFFFITECGQEGVNKETSYLFCPYCSKKLTTNEPHAPKAGEPPPHAWHNDPNLKIKVLKWPDLGSTSKDGES